MTPAVIFISLVVAATLVVVYDVLAKELFSGRKIDWYCVVLPALMALVLAGLATACLIAEIKEHI